MPITLQASERDALFGQISADFTLFSDLELAISRGEEEACYLLARKLGDGLRLLVEGGLGWKERTAAPTVLRLPDDELKRIMSRMKTEAVAVFESMRQDQESSRAPWDEIGAIRDTCEMVLQQTRS